jgi:hypothetical protein
VTVTQLVVGDDGDEATSDFGDNFQNLKLMNGTTQLGSTQGTLSGTAGADYTFSLSPAIKIAAGAQYVVDVYADILTGAAGFAAAGQPGLEFVSASATGDLTSSDATTGLAVTNLQNDVIAAAGGITIAADAATPVAAQIVMGTTDVEMAKLKFTASTTEDIKISRIKIHDSVGTAEAGLTNIKLYDGTTQLGSAVAAFASDYAEFNLPTDWIIAKGTTKTLTVKASVGSYPNATSAGTVKLEIAAAGDVDSNGANQAIAETVNAATGNTMTFVRTKITVAKSAGTVPAGVTGRAQDQNVAVISVTNSSTTDGTEAVISDLAVTITKGGTWTTTASSTVKVFKDVATAAGLVGYKAFDTGLALTSVALNGWTAGDTNPTATSLKDIQIGSGATVSIIITATTLDAPQYGSITASIGSSGMIWEDGVSTGASGLTTVNSLPVTSNTYTF